MRWVTFDLDGSDRVGVVRDSQIHALGAGVNLVDLIGGGAEALREVGEHALAEPDVVVALNDVVLRAPIPKPPSIRDFLCFLEHMRNCQVAAGRERTLHDRWYEIPAFYFACPATVLGPFDDVYMAPGSTWFDFELEIGAVIGPGGIDLTPEQAQDHIVGYMIYNDWSARDLQLAETVLAIGQGKSKDCALTLGPYLVTADELVGFQRDGRLALNVTARVNDRVVGTGTTADMDWSFSEVISYASRGVELRPGDIFGSGTVPTCTLVEHLRLDDLAGFSGWLRDGDTVTLEVEGLGALRQAVRRYPRPVAALAPRHNPDARIPHRPPNPAPARKVPYTKGLHDLGADIWAWLAPDGGYGWSNAGLVAGDGASLLVDTLFDLHLTREMLEAMAPITDRHPLRWAVMTHSNGDHTHGNQLLDKAVRIVAAEGTDTEMRHEPAPELLRVATLADLGPALTPYLKDRFGPFDFSGVDLRFADETFDRELVLDVGGRSVRVLNLGPAHTAADSVVHVPDAGVLFAGDLLFIGGTPVVWEGPISNWVTACDTMIGLDAEIVVPGHGPVTDADGIRAVRDYLSFIKEYAEIAHRKGQTFIEAADSIDLGEYAKWLDAERIVTNLYQHYRYLDPTLPELGVIQLMGLQAEWIAKHGS
ncbi:fumarylacetoacetate hydrolase family protein [Mycobacterium malmoense]|uniref:fumarylacetoacetate hydrolase family protein n=1 Tax=Mycobacterium malmoense TaxID=1780 RepID=UPI0008F96798|nr:fumarylacetoacetate hydrolase family protein [Mycobacterium malmoense]OIN79976.1 2-hydroxyhepta-2,4-diene-1,7-dioate isomerase [Mycobacterium malmoense]